MRFQAIGHVSHSFAFPLVKTGLQVINDVQLVWFQLSPLQPSRRASRFNSAEHELWGPVPLAEIVQSLSASLCESARSVTHSLTHSLAASLQRIPEFSRIGSTRRSFTLRDQRAAARAWQINSIQVVHTKTLPSPHSCAPPPSALSTQTNGNRSSTQSKKCRSYFVHSAPYRMHAVLP